MSTAEPFLEPILRRKRFSMGVRFLSKQTPLILVDVGCGPLMRFREYGLKHRIAFSRYIGVDPLLERCIIKKWAKEKTVELVKTPLDSCPKQLRGVADVVVAFALLEHVDDPLSTLRSMAEMIHPGGLLVLTTPSTTGKPVLEFLCYRLHLVSRREIDEHKTYFTRESLKQLAVRCGLEVVHHSYFIAGMNNLLVLKKPTNE